MPGRVGCDDGGKRWARTGMMGFHICEGSAKPWRRRIGTRAVTGGEVVELCAVDYGVAGSDGLAESCWGEE